MSSLTKEDFQMIAGMIAAALHQQAAPGDADRSAAEIKRRTDVRSVIKVFPVAQGPAHWFEVSNKHFYDVLINNRAYAELSPEDEAANPVSKGVEAANTKRRAAAGEDPAKLGSIRKISKT